MTPLRLEDSFFTRLSAQANPQFQPSESGGPLPEPVVEPRVQLARHHSDPRRYQLTLKVESDPETPEQHPYTLNLEMVGKIAVDETFQHDDLERLVIVNGASMLYSALREMVLIVTGRGAWGAVQLPTISFNQLDVRADE